jgi:hypothetical protein
MPFENACNEVGETKSIERSAESKQGRAYPRRSKILDAKRWLMHKQQQFVLSVMKQKRKGTHRIFRRALLVRKITNVRMTPRSTTASCTGLPSWRCANIHAVTQSISVIAKKSCLRREGRDVMESWLLALSDGISMEEELRRVEHKQR